MNVISLNYCADTLAKSMTYVLSRMEQGSNQFHYAI